MENGNGRSRRVRAGIGSFGTWVPAAGVAAAAMVLVAGCSGSASPSAGGTGAAGSTGSIGGSQNPVTALKAALTASTTGDDKTVTVTGTFSTPSASGQLSGQEEFAPDFGMLMNVTTGGTTISEIWVDNTIYLKDPQYASDLGSGKTWFSLDLSAMGPLGAVFSGAVDSVKDTDPAKLIEELLAADDLTSVGQQTVDGVKTTHYSGTVDPTTAYDSAAAKQNLTPAQIQQLEQLEDAIGGTSEKIDVWIASDGLPVRVAISETTSSGVISTQADFTAWGQPVNIAAPPASQVENMSSMFSGGLPSDL
jgi:hypothetical protein